MRYIIKIALLTLALLAPVPALATAAGDLYNLGIISAPPPGDPSAVKPAQPVSIPDGTAMKIFEKYATNKTMFTAAQSNAAAVSGMAQGTMAGLALIMFSWLGIQVAFGNGGHHTMTKLIETILEVGIFFFIFQQYDMLVQAIVNSMQALAGILSGGDQNAANGAVVLLRSAVAELNAIGSIANQGSWWGSKIGYVLEYIPQELVFAVSALIMLLASVIYIAMYFIGDAMAAVAISLGPLFVALGVSTWTRDFFNGWIKALLTGLGYKVVGATLVGLMGNMIVNAAGTFAVSGNYAQDFINAVATFIFSILCAYAMLKVPELASSLFGAGFKAGGGIQTALEGQGKDFMKGFKEGAKKP